MRTPGSSVFDATRSEALVIWRYVRVTSVRPASLTRQPPLWSLEPAQHAASLQPALRIVRPQERGKPLAREALRRARAALAAPRGEGPDPLLHEGHRRRERGDAEGEAARRALGELRARRCRLPEPALDLVERAAEQSHRPRERRGRERLQPPPREREPGGEPAVARGGAKGEIGRAHV